jgi:hypothetical protein
MPARPTRNHASCLGHAHRLTGATELLFGYGANDQPAGRDRRQADLAPQRPRRPGTERDSRRGMLAELLRRIAEYVRNPSGMPVLTRASFCAVGVDEGGSRSGAAEDQSRLRPAFCRLGQVPVWVQPGAESIPAVMAVATQRD